MGIAVLFNEYRCCVQWVPLCVQWVSLLFCSVGTAVVLFNGYRCFVQWVSLFCSVGIAVLFIGYRCCFPKVKGPVRDVDHPHPLTAIVKNAWVCTSDSPIRLHGVESDKYCC